MGDKFTYHYHGFRRTGNRENNIDGIAMLTFQIRTMEDYHQFKQVIAKDVEGRSDTEGLTITNLSLLSSESSARQQATAEIEATGDRSAEWREWRQWLQNEFDIDLTLSDEQARTELLERDEMMRADYGYLRHTVMPESVAKVWDEAIEIVKQVGIDTGLSMPIPALLAAKASALKGGK